MPTPNPSELPGADLQDAPDPSTLPGADLTAGGVATPVKSDSATTVDTVPLEDLKQGLDLQLSPEDHKLLETEAGLANLHKLPDPLKEIVVQRYIHDKKLTWYDRLNPMRLASEAWKNAHDMALGLGEGIGTAASKVWDAFNYSLHGGRTLEEDVGVPKTLEEGKLDLAGFYNHLAKIGGMEPVTDEDGNLIGAKQIPPDVAYDFNAKAKGLLSTVFSPHIEAFNKIKAGDISGGSKILFDHYTDNPLDFLFDASAVFGLAGSGLEKTGQFLAKAGEAGTVLGDANKLAEIGKGISDIGRAVDPLNLSAKVMKPVVNTIRAMPLKGSTIGEWLDMRKFVNGVHQSGFKEMRSRLMEDSDVIHEVFGDLDNVEIHNLSANIEGLAQPLNPTDAFKNSLTVYKQWIDAEDKYLMDQAKLTSQARRSAIYQPMMSATGMSLAELEDLVSRSAGISEVTDETLKNIRKAIQGEEVISDTARQAADVAKQNPEMADVSRRVAAATKGLDLGLKDDVADLLNQMDREAAAGTGSQLPPKPAGDLETAVRIARVNPYDAERYNVIVTEEQMWRDFSERLNKKKPLVEKAPAPRNVMVEQLRELKDNFNKWVDQAKAETTGTASVGPTTLSLEEAAAKAGVHRTPKRYWMRRMANYGVSDSDARSIFDVAHGGVPLDSSSVGQTIDEVADRTAAGKYGEDYTNLDPDTKHLASRAIAEQIKDEIRGLRAPIERGEKFGITPDTRQQLASTIYKMHRTAYDLDRFAGPGVVNNAFDRVSEYTRKALDEPILNPHFGEPYEYTNRFGQIKRGYRNSPIWEKGNNQFKDYKKYTRRANPATIGKQERLDNIATARARLNELAIAKKSIADNAESVASAYQSTFNPTGIDSDADAIIAHNMEQDANDIINTRSWMVNTLDKNIARGGPYLTPKIIDEAHADAVERSASIAGGPSRNAIAYHQEELDKLQAERARLTQVTDIKNLRQMGFTIPDEAIYQTTGRINSEALKEIIDQRMTAAQELAKKEPLAGFRAETEARSLISQREAYNENIKKLADIDNNIADRQRRIARLQSGVKPAPDEIPLQSAKTDSAPPPNLEEIPAAKLPQEVTSPAEPVARPSSPTMKVPKIIAEDMGKDMADPRAIIGRLSAVTRNDPQVMEAFRKVRDYATGRGIDITVGEGQTFDLSKIQSMMAEARVPRNIRIRTRQILNAYNEARVAIPEAEGVPFVAQQLLKKDVLTKDDLVKGAILSSKEAKFTEPSYYPHIFEPKLNTLDGRTPQGKQVIDNIEANAVNKADLPTAVKRELYYSGYTGYYDKDGKFIPITKGQGVRQWFSDIWSGKASPIITKPAFLKKRTGAWGYVTADPESVLAIHRVQFQDYRRKLEMLDKLQAHPSVEPLADPVNMTDLKPGNVPFSFEGVKNYYMKSIDFKGMVNKAIRASGSFSDKEMMDAILKHMPDELRVGPIPGSAKIVQVPQSMVSAIKANISADMPSPLVRNLIDKPTSFFRGMVLAFNPHFWLNHIVGHTVLNTLGGVAPLDYIMAKMKMFDGVFPSELYSGTFYLNEARQDAAAFSSRKAFSQAYGVVGNVDNYYREAAYIHHGLNIARKEGMLKSIFSAYDANQAMEALKQVSNNPALKSRAIDAVNEWLFDYNKMDPFERKYVRRIIPFWSFWKNISSNFYMMPLRHPLKAQVFKDLAEIGHEAVREHLNERGIDYEDLSNFMQGRVLVNTGDGKEGMMTTRMFNPYQDVFNLPALSQGLQSESHMPGLNPLITLPVERMTGVNLRTAKPFTDPNVDADTGGGMYLDPRTGQIAHNARPVPALWDHIARQTPQYEMLKDIIYWLRGNKLGGQYDTGDLINPKFMMDPKTGENKYPRSLQLEFLKTMGLNIMQLDDLRKMQDQEDQQKSKFYQDMYSRKLVEDKNFEPFVQGEIKKIGESGWAGYSEEEKMKLAREQLRKITRPKR